MPHGAREAVRKRRERTARRPPDTAKRPPDAALGDVSRPPDTIEALRARLIDAHQPAIDEGDYRWSEDVPVPLAAVVKAGGKCPIIQSIWTTTAAGARR